MRRSEWRHAFTIRIDIVPLAKRLPPRRVKYCSWDGSVGNPKLSFLQAHISLFYRAAEIVEKLNLKAKLRVGAGAISVIEMQHEVTIIHRSLTHLMSPGK